MLTRLDRWMQHMVPGNVALLCAALTAVLGGLDHFTGYELSFSVFYLAPVAIASWYGSRSMGTVAAVLCAGVWLLMDITAGHAYSSRLLAGWNTGVRLGFFFIISHLLHRLRFHLAQEKRLARTDALTGALNGRAFEEEAGRILALGKRHGHSLSLAYCDLDDFKRVNDTKGHSEGDRLLQEVARTLGESLRATDLVARLGGDEFALLLPETDMPGAQQLIARVRGRLQQCFCEGEWPISCSIGTVVFTMPPASVNEAIHAADSLMYEAKAAGKNRTVFALRDA